MYTLPPSAGVLKQGYMYPEGYVCLSEGVYLRLIIEGKNMFTYYSFRNIYRYISEYYFQNHYMLIAKYVFVIFLTLFVIKIFCWGLTSIPTPAWTNCAGSTPEQKSFHPLSSLTVLEPRRFVEEMLNGFLNQFVLFTHEQRDIPGSNY